MLGQGGDALSKIELDEHENFSQATIEKFKSDPEFYRSFVKGIEKEVNDGFRIVSDAYGPLAAAAVPPQRQGTEELTALKKKR
jgi:hypothetical protein